MINSSVGVFSLFRVQDKGLKNMKFSIGICVINLIIQVMAFSLPTIVALDNIESTMSSFLNCTTLNLLFRYASKYKKFALPSVCASA